MTDILERLENPERHPSHHGPDAPDAALEIRNLRANIKSYKATIDRMKVDGGPYYIQASSQVVGNEAVWWKPEGYGYTTHLSDAGKYTKEDADYRHNNRASDVPWLVAEVESIAHWTVNVGSLLGIKR